MDWHLGMYRTITPSRARRLAMSTVMITALLAVYGARTEFVPSKLGADFGFFVSAAVTLVSAPYLWHGYYTGRIPWGRKPKRLITRTLCLAFIPLVIFGLSWLISVRAVPDIAARPFGTHTSRSLELEASYRPRRRSCDHQLRGDQLRFPWYLCVSPSEFGRFSPIGANQPLRPIAREDVRSG
jgi:hypothetical protein